MSLLQEMVSVAFQNAQDMESIVKESTKNGKNGSSHLNGNDPYKHFVSLAFTPKGYERYSGYIFPSFPLNVLHLQLSSLLRHNL